MRRKIELDHDVIVQALTQYMVSLSTINDDEEVTEVTEFDEGMFVITIEKE